MPACQLPVAGTTSQIHVGSVVLDGDRAGDDQLACQALGPIEPWLDNQDFVATLA
jgi:hypothetical protein